MKATKIYTSSPIEGIQKMIDAAEGKAAARTLNAGDLCAKATAAEKMMHWPSKKSLKGTKITVHASTEKLPNAYKYRAESTQAELEHDGKGWVIVEVKRATLKQSSACKIGLEIQPSDAVCAHIFTTLSFC